MFCFAYQIMTTHLCSLAHKARDPRAGSGNVGTRDVWHF